MPVTPPQTHVSQQGPRESPRGYDQNNRRSNRTPSSLILPISGYTKLHYNTQHLSLVSAERAVEGIDASFIFHSLESIIDN